MATLTIQQLTTAGSVTSTTAAGASGDTFANTGRQVLEVTNGSGGSINVTVDSPTPCNQGGTHDLVVAVADGATKRIGPFDPARFTSTVSITYSATTSVTVAVIGI